MFRKTALLLPVALVLAVALATAAEKEKVVMPFNGRTLEGWTKKKHEKNEGKWVVGRAVMNEKEPTKLSVTPINPAADGGPAKFELINADAGSVDLYTNEKFGDCTVELEFMIPKSSNSGIYLMGEYEVQILDSFGKDKVGPGDLGGIYNTAAPNVNASKKPGEWQKFVIDFQAPRFEGDNKTAGAKFVKVTLNDKVIHENVEMKGPTPGGLTGKEAATGPLMFQGDHGPVAFRNIKVITKNAK